MTPGVRREWLVVFAFTAIFVGQAAWTAATTSGTYDESTYLQLGLDAYHHGAFSGFPQRGVAPLPVLLCYFLPSLAASNDYARLIWLARLSAIVTIGIPLVILSYVSMRRASGRTAATIGTALIVLSPNLVAHSALGATDACFMMTAIAAMLTLARYIEHPSRTRLIALAFGLSLALASKYSAVALFPVVAAVLAIGAGTSEGFVHRAWRASVLTLGLAAVALAVAWALHGFILVPSVTRQLRALRIPAPVEGFAVQLIHQHSGHPAFLLGQRSSSGWWYYLPVAFLLKSTTAELILIAIALYALAAGWRKTTPSGRVWRVALVVFGLTALSNRLDLGIRYALLLLPLCIFVATEMLSRARMPRLGLAFSAALVLAQAASAISIGPHYLSYFNRFAGGPAEGYRYLADSNVDWGQDLPALRATLERIGARRTLLSYFGTAPPSAYGLSVDIWSGEPEEHLERWDWIAVSATYLDGVYLVRDPFAPLRSLAPSARAGYSILLYSTARSDVRTALPLVARRMRAASNGR